MIGLGQNWFGAISWLIRKCACEICIGHFMQPDVDGDASRRLGIGGLRQCATRLLRSRQNDAVLRRKK